MCLIKWIYEQSNEVTLSNKQGQFWYKFKQIVILVI